jgi:hypothetical protein
MSETSGYEAIKALAGQTGRTIPGLLALSRKNDPFYAGSPAKLRDAEWFVQIWKRFSFGNGIHVRRIHYRLVIQPEPVLDVDGMPYNNTTECWDYLGEASKSARYLKLVYPAAFVDRRNPEPQIFSSRRSESVHPTVYVRQPGVVGQPDWRLPRITAEFDTYLELPQPLIEGYDYELADQRYHLAIWIEKSTMNDVLEPLCSRYGVDLITGVGFQSITSVISLLRDRAARHGKPVRLFYISDFDPAGEHMPIATARQIEFWSPDYCPEVEIKLQPLALTKEQVIAYGLPRIPIKDSDRRKGNFEDRHGEGACELDALEALHPGELARIVEQAIAPYFDSDLEESLAETESEAYDSAEEEWESLTEEVSGELEEIRVDAEKIADKYRERVTTLQKKFAKK